MNWWKRFENAIAVNVHECMKTLGKKRIMWPTSKQFLTNMNIAMNSNHNNNMHYTVFISSLTLRRRLR